MDAAEALPTPLTPLTEMLSWAEIQARFPYQYVVILQEDEDISGGFDAIRGRVVNHGKWPMELVPSVHAWRNHHDLIGFYFTGVGMPDEDRDALPAQP